MLSYAVVAYGINCALLFITRVATYSGQRFIHPPKNNKMRILYTIVIFCCLHAVSNAQTAATYNFSQSTGSYSAVSGGTTIFSGSWDDNVSSGRSIGFTFRYCGTDYTTFNINANGWINFGSSPSSSYTPLSARTNAIAVMGGDLYRRSTSGSGVVSEVSGSSPNRVLTIEWFNVCRYSNASTGPMNFQIKLYETSNKIEFVYGTYAPTSSSTYTYHVGINGSSSSDYNNRTTTSNWSTTTGGTSNTATCTSNNSVMPSSGLTFTWCPPVPSISGTGVMCAGNTVTLTNSMSGGTWVSGNTSIATVGAGTGIVTGVSGGTATISYVSQCGNAATRVVTVNAAPAVPSGSSSICTGVPTTYTSSGTGAWSSSNTSVATVGATTGIVTGVAAGTVNITYTATAGCLQYKTVTVNTSPAAITGSDNVCTGATISLANTTSGGTWSSSNTSSATVISGVVSGVSTGTPTIFYTMPGGCSSTMPITVNLMPAAISGITSVCGSLTTTLANSVSGGTWTTSSAGIAHVGSTGIVTGGSAGMATITYTLPGGCYRTHTMTVHPLSAIAGTPSMCVGYSTTLTNATTGGTWSSSNTAIAPVSSGGIVSGASIGTAVISYTMPATGCTATETVAVTNPPAVYAVTGGGAFCSSGTGVLVGLAGSDAGVTYQLYNSTTPIGASLTGTGSAISYGLFITPGIYGVIANPGTACATTMAGTAVISVNSLPPAFLVSGGGSYCADGAGVHVYLNSSTVGVNYQLYNGTTPVGGPFIGTSAAIDFGLQISAGTYTIVGTDVYTGCTNTMTGSATISINPLPGSYSVAGGGAYCSGGTGLSIGLSGSTTGIQYQLQHNGAPLGGAVSGTGGSISYGLHTLDGTYTVVATNTTTGCTNTMTGAATIVINTLPTAYTVTGGGNYCSGGTGVNIGLSSSATGVSYQLKRGVTDVGSPLAGTGTAIDFGLQTTTGTYAVYATNIVTGCATFMTGSAMVGTLSVPTNYSVIGGGGYCTGGTGVAIGLSGSETGTNYYLYNGGSLVDAAAGTGSSISFGLKTTAGGYTVTATNVSTGCSRNMLGTANVAINPLPSSVFGVTGGGNYCAGGPGVLIGLGGSETGVSYRLHADGIASGAAVNGTGTALSFGTRTGAGTYSVIATNTSTTCANTLTGSVSVGINPLPTVYGIIGGGAYCASLPGVHIGLSNSNSGVSYQLYEGTTAVGPVVSGTGSSIDMGLQTTAGTYTVKATNTLTGCSSNMSGSTNVSVDPVPIVHTVTGGGNYCIGDAGVHIGLGSSSTGYNYQLLYGGAPVGVALAGTGSPLDFGVMATTGLYTVEALGSLTGCAGTMGTASVGVLPLPAMHVVNGGGSICADGPGVAVTLLSSEAGVNYQLYNGTAIVGTAIAGTGAVVDFGLQTLAGTYTVVVENVVNGCTRNMTGSAVISVIPAPAVFSVAGGGNYCPGGSGVFVGLDGSQPGVYYQLYRGGIPAGMPVMGTGMALNFGPQTTPGSYTVVATDVVTTCTKTMSGIVGVGISSLPVAHIVTGGGGYCPGGIGVDVGLDGSEVGVNYQLYTGASPVGTATTGDGGALSFGAFTIPGIYTVRATSAITGCSSLMTGGANIMVSSPPPLFNVTGGGDFCPGAPGVRVGLSGSTTGVSYELYRDGLATGIIVPGSGTYLDMGLQATAGNYKIAAIASGTTCGVYMSGNAAINTYPVPASYIVSGGGNYCMGDGGVPVGLLNSEVGISYQLYNGTTPVGSAIPGSGAAITFGIQTMTGTYSVVGTNSMGCEQVMIGDALVNEYPLPGIYPMTGGGNYCAGGIGVSIGLGYSDAGTHYQLYRGATTVGEPLPGGGAAIDFGLQTLGGSYNVVATNSITGCHTNMAGTTNVTVDLVPVAYSISGGGNFCSGGTGLPVTLSGSNTGVSYQLFAGTTPVGGPVAGTGAALDLGIQTVVGTYTIVGTNITSTCSNNMTGSVTISTNTLPLSLAVSGGGAYCTGEAGMHVGLGGSETGISYQLYRDASVVGLPMGGTGLPLDFGLYTTSGNYTITATNTATGCRQSMSGAAVIMMNSLPDVYPATGGGAYCDGGTGVHIGLLGSRTGISYQAFNGGVASGPSVTGTGGPLDFGLRTGAGVYTITATDDATGCVSNMSGSASVMVSPQPSAYTITGGGNYCSGGAGVHIGLSGSEHGVNYQLLWEGSAIGTAFAGTGLAIDFGLNTSAGTYTVIATHAVSGCSKVMTGVATVGINSLPVIYNVSGGGSYCAGGSGVAVGLSGSDAGMTYTLYSGLVPTGTATGTGSAFDFGLQTSSGTYTVKATSGSTGCISEMFGSADVVINPLPAAHTVVGGGSYCESGSGVNIGLAASVPDVNYQLFRGAVAIGSPGTGTGFAIDLGRHTAAGFYTVKGTSTITGCENNMTGGATITVLPASATAVVISSSAGDTACTGTLVTLTAMSLNGGASPDYEWAVNGAILGAGSSFTYVPENGDVVTVDMISSLVCAAPRVAVATKTMLVLESQTPSVTVTVHPGANICQGTVANYAAIPSYGGVSPSYEWIKNGILVGVASVYSYVPDNADEIECRMISGYRCRRSDVANSTRIIMDVDAPVAPKVAVEATPGIIAPGQAQTLSATVTDGGAMPLYTWRLNGAVIAGATNNSITRNDFVNGDVVTCNVTNGAGCTGLQGAGHATIRVRGVGVNNVSLTESNIQLLPNPSKGAFTIKGTLERAADHNLSIVITDLLGRIVYNGVITTKDGMINEPVQLGNAVSNGMYLVNLLSEGDQKVFHLVIER